jgi:hypothetical protein
MPCRRPVDVLLAHVVHIDRDTEHRCQRDQVCADVITGDGAVDVAVWKDQDTWTRLSDTDTDWRRESTTRLERSPMWQHYEGVCSESHQNTVSESSQEGESTSMRTESDSALLTDRRDATLGTPGKAGVV